MSKIKILVGGSDSNKPSKNSSPLRLAAIAVGATAVVLGLARWTMTKESSMPEQSPVAVTVQPAQSTTTARPEDAIAPSPVQIASPVAIAPTPSAPVPSAPSTVAGIGVSRQKIQTVFEKPEVGFSFEPSSMVDGQPRVMGKSANELAIVELIGVPSELTSATIIVGIPNDNPRVREQNALFTVAFIKLAAPEWAEGSDWLSEQLRVLANSSTNEATTVFGDNRAKLTFLRESSLLFLSIKPNQ